MRALKRTRELPIRLDDSFETLLAQFSATTLELNPSLGAVQFSRRLTARAAEMLGARAAVLGLARAAGEWEIAALSGPAHRWNPTLQRELAEALAGRARLPSGPLCVEPAAEMLGQELSQALGWESLVLAKLNGSDGMVLGVLVLVDPPQSLTSAERQLLEALTSHASVALENVRLFSRVEQSRRQWVEDVDAISDFIVVHDAENRVLRLNRALADRLEMRPTEAVGRDMGQLEILGTPVRAQRCAFCRDAEAAREEFIYETGERIYLVSSSRIHSGADDELRTIHVLKDITDRREAERRYRRERDFNKNILNNTQSMILVLDTAGLVSYANRRCFESGYAEREILGRPLVERVPAARRAALAEALDRALAGAALDNLELPLTRANGTAGQFSISLSPMRDEQGEINSIVVVMTDITDAADLQAKLMHTEKMAALGQLVSGVAHEVNNPLAAIVGFTDLLLESPSVPDAAKEDLNIILQEAQRTRAIVQNLLSFARRMPAQREAVHVEAVLRQTLKLRAYDLSNHGVEITEVYEENLPPAMGDAHQLQQVFLNILNNAYDAVQETHRGGKIGIEASHKDGVLEVRIRDNGPGIAHPEKIFDPFFTTKEVGKGTGLGLSICYGIVRTHRGEIAAANNADGPGCTFSVRLPVAKDAELAATEAAR